MREKPVSARLLFCNCAKKKSQLSFFQMGWHLTPPAPTPLQTHHFPGVRTTWNIDATLLKSFIFIVNTGKSHIILSATEQLDQFRSWVYHLVTFWGELLAQWLRWNVTQKKKKTTPDPVYDNNLWSTKPWKGHKKLVFATPNKASHHFLIAIDITINWRHCQYFFFPPQAICNGTGFSETGATRFVCFFTLQHLYKTFCQCGMLNWVGRQVTNAEMTAD